MAQFTKKLYFVVSFDTDFDGNVLDNYEEATVYDSLKEAKEYVMAQIDMGYPEDQLMIFEGTFKTRPKRVSVEWE
jgi:hypothetical protein